MPFTPSHAAVVLPLLRTPLPASALVIGSVAPDLPFYLPVAFPWATHTALSVVTTDLLLGLAAWAVWHAVLAPPALACSPAALRARLGGTPLGLRARVLPARRLGAVMTALVVGAATHVLIDEFTHPGRWGAERIPALAATWGLLPGYRWLQWLGSAAGALVLLALLVRWCRRTARPPGAHRPAPSWPWALIVAAGTVAGVTAAGRVSGPGAAGVALATWGGGAALVVAVVLALAWHLSAAGHDGARPGRAGAGSVVVRRWRPSSRSGRRRPR